jgi:hypothetical protein
MVTQGAGFTQDKARTLTADHTIDILGQLNFEAMELLGWHLRLSRVWSTQRHFNRTPLCQWSEGERSLARQEVYHVFGPLKDTSTGRHFANGQRAKEALPGKR